MQPKQLHRFKPLNSTSNSNKFEYTKFFPYVVPALILFGVSKLSFYYNYFNVSIISFLEFGEIITSFFNFIVSIFITIISLVVIIIISYSLEDISIRNKRITGFLSLFILLFALDFIALKMKLEYFGVGMILILPATIIMLYVVGNSSEFPKRIDGIKKLILVSLSFLSFMFIVWCGAFLDFDRVKNRKMYYGVRISYLDSTVFISDSNTYYIGNTSNYLFIYNQKENKTQVEKISTVKTIEFPKRRGLGYY
jgi:hypothetical protein